MSASLAITDAGKVTCGKEASRWGEIGSYVAICTFKGIKLVKSDSFGVLRKGQLGLLPSPDERWQGHDRSLNYKGSAVVADFMSQRFFIQMTSLLGVGHPPPVSRRRNLCQFECLESELRKVSTWES